jgi:hypothetical protein
MAQFDVNTIIINVQPHTSDILEFYASEAGGAITLLEARATNHVATSSNTSFSVCIVKYSDAGTPALAGTVFLPRGGTADHWQEALPKPMTLVDSERVVEAGQWLALQVTRQNNGTPTYGKVVLHYVGGKA